MAFTSIISTINCLNEVHINQAEALGLINVIVELMILSPPKDESDLTHRNQKILGIVKKLKTSSSRLQSDVTFMLFLSKFLQNVLNMIPLVSNIDATTSEHKLLREVIVDKFLALVGFALKINENPSIHEIFCNMFYYLLTSERLKPRHKLQLLNHFFTEDGHNFMVKVIGYENGKAAPINHFKSTLVMAVVVNSFVKILNKSSDNDKTLTKKSFEIVFKANKKLMDPLNYNTSLETMMLYTFLKFVDLTWKNPKFCKNDVCCNVSLILAITKVQKIAIQPIFFHMLTVLFTSTFPSIIIENNNLLQVSSSAILESKHSKKIDLSYLKWWKIMGNPNPDEFNKVLTDFVVQKDNRELENLNNEDLMLFDWRLIMEAFLSPTTFSIDAHSNFKKVLCCFPTPESSPLYLKLLKKFQNLESQKDEKRKQQRLINVMDVMNVIARNLNDAILKIKTAKALMKTLKAPSTSQHVKLSAIQIATNLMTYKD